MRFRLTVDGETNDLEATTREGARVEARKILKQADWGPLEKTIWVRGAISGEDGVQLDFVRVTIDPPEPECFEGYHDWVPAADGMKENPGVHGHGGGVIIKKVCRSCDCVQTTNTWASDPNTGEQGLLSISYWMPT